MKLKLTDPNMAAIYGLPQQDTDTEAILREYAARGWKDADTMRQIDAAVAAGAYTRSETKPTQYPTRSEKVVRAGDAQGVKDNG